MRTLFPYAERLGEPLLRLSLGLVLLWIGWHRSPGSPSCRHFAAVSLPFLAANQFVYGLKVLEIIGGVLLIAVSGCAMSLCCRCAVCRDIEHLPDCSGSDGLPMLTLTGSSY